MTPLTLQAAADSLVISRDPKLGIIACKVKCHALDLISALRGPCPDIGLTALRENQPRAVTRRVGGDVDGFDATITLEGHEDPSNADGEDYELDGTLSEDPIESNPDFDLLITTYDGTEDATTGRALWPKTMAAGTGATDSSGSPQLTLRTIDGTSGAGSTETRNPMHGVDSYKVPSIIWTRSWVSQHIPAGLIRELGTLTASVPGAEAPQLTGRELWFCIRITGQYRGNIWQLKQSWQKTGPYGVAPELYRRA